MIRARLICLSSVIFVALGSAGASAAGNNATATQSYVRANSALVHIARAHLAAEEAAPKSVLHRLSTECPNAALQSPQNELSEHLSNEIIGAIVIEAAKPDAGALHTFLKVVTPLHWASSSLNHTMSAYVRSLTTLTKLAVPDVCADIKAWAATNYQTLPPTTLKFDAAFLPNWVAIGYQPKALSSFESGSTKSLAGRAKPLEGQLQDAEARAVATWGEILNVVQLGP
jgi:hypothetical protein